MRRRKVAALFSLCSLYSSVGQLSLFHLPWPKLDNKVYFICLGLNMNEADQNKKVLSTLINDRPN